MNTAFRLRLRRIALATPLLLSIAGCATLPASGPTAHEIRRGAEADRNGLGFQIVDIDPTVMQTIEAQASAWDASQGRLDSLGLVGRNDLVGPGDVLSIGLYEVGVSLFGSGVSRDSGTTFDPTAHGENFPAIVVDGKGQIRLPYVGVLHVAGRTTADIQAMIEHGLKGKSQSPQALVTLRQNIVNTVYVAGDVRKPGRLELTLQRERLLDAIALAGGASYSAEDTIVRFNRANRIIEERLGRIQSGAADDLVLMAGDRIELIKRPRSFIVLGATSRVSQVSFETGDLSLAEAIARAGGPTDAQADPSAIYLFRYAPPGSAAAHERPVIYRLNMLQPSSYFLSQKFAVRDKDVIYVANAAANRPAKLVNIINTLFSPFVAARAVAGY